MTRYEFINYAITNNSLKKSTLKTFFPFDRKKIEAEIQKKYNSEFNSKNILDFFENIGIVKFKRKESVSGDILKIELRWLAYIPMGRYRQSCESYRIYRKLLRNN
ncbi:MAG: hypothetical protein HDT47_05975 [Ruminococcaceae bacterium]|nr:hypothetical protein [Oscillospiraceae bacterium]